MFIVIIPPVQILSKALLMEQENYIFEKPYFIRLVETLNLIWLAFHLLYDMRKYIKILLKRCATYDIFNQYGEIKCLFSSRSKLPNYYQDINGRAGSFYPKASNLWLVYRCWYSTAYRGGWALDGKVHFVL